MNPLAIGGLALGAGSFIANLFSQKRDYELQKENLKWQKHVQTESWKREDDAVQRRVADLQAAGLNKVLAAGSAAQAGTTVQTTPPKAPNYAESMMAMLSALKMTADITKTDAEKAMINMQHDKLYEDALLSQTKRSMNIHDLNIAQKTGTKTGFNSQGFNYGLMLRDLLSSKSKSISRAIKKAKKTVTSRSFWFNTPKAK